MDSVECEPNQPVTGEMAKRGEAAIAGTAAPAALVTLRCVRLLLLLLAIASFAELSTARADEVSDFYRGKQVTLYVGFGPGGGYDVYARLLARHIGKYIPGRPNVVVQNLPGAGSLRAANYIYSVAPKDGTAFGLFARDMVVIALLGGDPNVHFDPRQFTWLGSTSSYANDAYVLMLRKDAPVNRSPMRGVRAARRWCLAAAPRAPPATMCRSCCATFWAC